MFKLFRVLAVLCVLLPCQAFAGDTDGDGLDDLIDTCPNDKWNVCNDIPGPSYSDDATMWIGFGIGIGLGLQFSCYLIGWISRADVYLRDFLE